MDLTTWVIAVELLSLSVAGIYLGLRDRAEQAAVRRLAVRAFTQHPIANVAPPTNTVTVGPDGWIVDLQSR